MRWAGEGGWALACFNNTNSIFETLQLTILCVWKTTRLPLINFGCAGLFKLSMVNHGFLNSETVNAFENAIVREIKVPIKLYITQIEENSNILGGMFHNLLLIFSVFSGEK